MAEAVSPTATRRRVLELLLSVPEPLEARSVADRLGLHVTTARFHLDRLVRDRLAERRPAREPRRGRPRILYSPTTRARGGDVRDQMIGVLAAALAGQGEDAALRAGRAWAASLRHPDGDPVDALTDVLAGLGFDPEHDGRALRLRACPFRGVARAHPGVVCAVHRGLIEELVADHPVQVGLRPFAAPDLCVVDLSGAA